MDRQNRLVPVLLLCLCSLGFLFSGCSTDPKSPNTLSPNGTKIASDYLKLASESQGSIALGYQLQAAELLIQFGKISDAQRILRTVRFSTEIDPDVRRTILNTRLALLKNDPDQAQILLKAVREKIVQNIPIPTLSADGNHPTERIAILLPSKGPYAETAKVIQDGFLAAYYQHTKTSAQHSAITIKIYDLDSSSVAKVAKAYQKALQEQANLIVGPLTKSEVADIANIPLRIPVLALNQISQKENSTKLYQFALRPEDEVNAVSEKAYKQGHRQALLLYSENTLGTRLSDAFKQAWKSRGATVLESRGFKSVNDLESKLKSLLQWKNQHRRKDADMIFIAVNAEEARQIKPLLNFYDAENLAVYGTAALYHGRPDPTHDQNLNNIHFCDIPWVLQHSHQLQETQQALEKAWGHSANSSPRFFAFGMDAYTLALHLLKADPWPTHGIYGLTGTLSLDAQQHIQRGLVCAQFQKGIPSVYP